jgi:hypothetical protein
MLPIHSRELHSVSFPMLCSSTLLLGAFDELSVIRALAKRSESTLKGSEHLIMGVVVLYELLLILILSIDRRLLLGGLLASS